MTARRHRRDTRTFHELTFQEQAKSINAQLSTLTRAVRVHILRSKDAEKTRAKCIAQVHRLRERIER